MRATNLDEAIEKALAQKQVTHHVCLKCRNCRVRSWPSDPTPVIDCKAGHWGGEHYLADYFKGHDDFLHKSHCPDRTRE